MFKWEPIAKLYAQPAVIQSKLGKILMGYRDSTGTAHYYVSSFNSLTKRWDFSSLNPSHFMLLEPLPVEKSPGKQEPLKAGYYAYGDVG